MEKKDKILITILVILLITIIVGVWLYCTLETTNTKNEVNNTAKQENKIEEQKENKVEENMLEEENAIEENVVEKNEINETETTSNIVGKEEKESKTENTGKTNEEKAIEVAKKEWGTTDGVSFDIQNREGNIYTVAVRSISNTQVYAWYRVNVETESIEE